MNQIIVAIDFSDSSLHAANYAADLAVSLKKDITLIHVMEIPITPFQVPLTEIEFTEIETAVKEELAELGQKLLQRTNNKINISKELKYGLIDQELEKLCKEVNPFAIVMGVASGARRMRFFLGSNTLRLIHDASYPVLIIPEKTVFKPIKNITIASDLFEMYPDKSLHFIKEWLKAFSPNCDIVFVEPDQKSSLKFLPETHRLQKFFREFNPKFHFIDSANIHTGIINFIEEKKPDMLIVLPENHGVLGSLFHTSISRKLVLGAHLPVLSVAVKRTENNLESNNNHSQKEKHDCSVCNGTCKKETIAKKQLTKVIKGDDQHP
jgi:nucleotide-binding universal stress UspA family protein